MVVVSVFNYALCAVSTDGPRNLIDLCPQRSQTGIIIKSRAGWATKDFGPY